MSRLARLAALALVAAPAALLPRRAAAQDDARPVVAVLYFDNNAFGKQRAEFEGLGKGVADLLINDLTAAGRFRVVERDRLQALLAEQDLVKSGSADARTAVRLGKLLGAQYMITGGFITDSKENLVLTARAIDVETGVISNPQKVQAKGDDVLALVAQLSDRLGSNLKLSAKPMNEVVPAGTTTGAAVSKEARAEATAAAKGEAKAPTTRPEPAKMSAAPAKRATQPKMDVRTTLLYAKALDEQDRGNTERATELYRAVLTRVPDYAPAKDKLAKLEKARS